MTRAPRSDDSIALDDNASIARDNEPTRPDNPVIIAPAPGQSVPAGRYRSRSDDGASVLPPEWPPPIRNLLKHARRLPRREVAALTGLSPDAIRRRSSHVSRKMCPRRVAMKLRDALAIG